MSDLFSALAVRIGVLYVILQGNLWTVMVRGNTFGELFTLTSFGESHSEYIGGSVDGFPGGVVLDMDFIKQELARRRPSSIFSTKRVETDNVEFISGLEDGKTLGLPLAFIIPNNNIRKGDYDCFKDLFRPSHGDYTYHNKYGIIASSGGGRASGRETAARVVGGALAKLFLKRYGITFSSKLTEIGGFDCDREKEEVEKRLKEAYEKRDSLGGKIMCEVADVPAGLGEPVFNKLSALLAHAQMSIPSAKSFELGDGLESCKRFGSEDMDKWEEGSGTLTNHSGGIQAGISNGEKIVFSVGFKPAASIGTVVCRNKSGELFEVKNEGRHDVAPVLRCGVVVEAMAALVIADLMKAMDNKTAIK